MRLLRQFQACFFFKKKKKRFCAQKHSQANINQQNKIKQALNNKGNDCLPAQTSKRVKVTCFLLWCFLCVQNLSVKKIKQA